MPQSSFGMYDEDEDEDYSASAMPMAAEDRASTSIQSHNFAKPARPDPVTQSATSARATPSMPEAPPMPGAQTPSPAPASPQPVANYSGFPQAPDRASLAQIAEQVSQPINVPPILHAPRVSARAERAVQQRDKQLYNQQVREAEQQRGDMAKYLADQGVEFDLTPDGGATPRKDPNGGLVFKSGYLADEPIHKGGDTWVKPFREPDGSVREVDIRATGQYKTDPQTGIQYFRNKAGEPIQIGQDESVLERQAMLAHRNQLREVQAQERALRSMEAADLDAEKEALGLEKEEIKEIGETPTMLKAQLDNLIAGNKLTGLDPAKAERWKAAKTQYDEWHRANPTYNRLVESTTAREQDIAARESSMIQRRQSIAQRNAEIVGLLSSDGSATVLRNSPASASNVMRFDLKNRISEIETRAQEVQAGVQSGQVPAAEAKAQLTQLEEQKQAAIKADTAQIPVTNGDVDAAALSGVSTHIAAASGASPTQALRSTMESLMESGAETVGGKPIKEELARLDALQKAEAVDPKVIRQQRRDMLTKMTPEQRKRFVAAEQEHAEAQQSAQNQKTFAAKGFWDEVGSGYTKAFGTVPGRLAGAGRAALAYIDNIPEFLRPTISPVLAATSFLQKAGVDVDGMLEEVVGWSDEIAEFTPASEKAQGFKLTEPKTWSADGAGSWIVGNGLPVAIELGIDLGLSAITGPAAPLTFIALGGGKMAGEQFNSAMEDYTSQGIDEKDAKAMASVESLAMFVFGATLDRIPAAQFLTRTGAGSEILKKFVHNKYVREGIAGFVAEALPESGQELVSMLLEAGFRDASKAFEGGLERFASAFVLGGMAGSMVGVGQTALGDLSTQQQKSALEKLDVDPAEINDTLLSVRAQIAEVGGSDPVKLIDLQEKALRYEGMLHTRIMQLLGAVPNRAEIANTVGVADVEALTSTLNDNRTATFALAEMGALLQENGFLTPEQITKLDQIAGEGGARALANIMVGQQAATVLETVLKGGTITQDQTAALEANGLVQTEANPDGTTTLMVTDDAVPILSPKAVALAKTGTARFVTTPGTVGNGNASIATAGQGRLATLLKRKAQRSGEGVVSQQWNVSVNGAEPTLVTARSEAEAITAAGMTAPKGATITATLVERQFAEVTPEQRAAEIEAQNAKASQIAADPAMSPLLKKTVAKLRLAGQKFKKIKGINARLIQGSVNSGGALYDPPTKTVTLSRNDMLLSAELFYSNALAAGNTEQQAMDAALDFVDKTLAHEFIHIGDVMVNNDKATADLWNSLPVEIRNATKIIYSRANPFADMAGFSDVQWGREYKRILTEKRLAGDKDGISELAGLTVESATKTANKSWVAKVIDQLNAIKDWLKKQGVGSETTRQVDAIIAQLKAIQSEATGIKPGAVVIQQYSNEAGEVVSAKFQKQDNGDWMELRTDSKPAFIVSPARKRFYESLEEKAKFAADPKASDPVKKGEFKQPGYTAMTDAPNIEADLAVATESDASINARTPVGEQRDAAKTERRKAAVRIAKTLQPGDRIVDEAAGSDFTVDSNYGDGTVMTASGTVVDAAAEIRAGATIERANPKVSNDTKSPAQSTAQQASDISGLSTILQGGAVEQSTANELLKRRLVADHKGEAIITDAGVKVLEQAGIKVPLSPAARRAQIDEKLTPPQKASDEADNIDTTPYDPGNEPSSPSIPTTESQDESASDRGPDAQPADAKGVPQSNVESENRGTDPVGGGQTESAPTPIELTGQALKLSRIPREKMRELITQKRFKDDDLMMLAQYLEQQGDTANARAVIDELDRRVQVDQQEAFEKSFETTYRGQKIRGDLMSFVLAMGGLPSLAKGKKDALTADLRQIWEAPGGKNPKLWRKDSLGLDRLAEMLREQGFKWIETPNDLIDSILESLSTGKFIPPGSNLDDEGQRLMASKPVPATERITPENKVAKSINGKPAAEIFADVKKRHGVTRSIYEAGYVLPDGTMLDFTGRSETGEYEQGNDLAFRIKSGRDWMKDQRGVDHREIEWQGMPEYRETWEPMVAFLRLGAVRVDGRSGTISMHSRAKITAAQASVLKDIVVSSDGAYMDLEDDAGNRTAMSLEGGKWGKVNGVLNRWANGETPEIEGTLFASKPREDLFSNPTPTQPAPTPDDVAKWSKALRTLQRVERETGKLNPGQRRMMDNAERILGQARMFEDMAKSQAPQAQSPRANFRDNRLIADDLVTEQDLFDARSQSGVGRFAPGQDQGSLFASAPAFYSRLEQVIDQKIQGKAGTPQQIKAIIDPAKGSGVKPEEIKWTGIEQAIDRIAGENNGKVPKDALMKYLRDEGAVRFEEVGMGGPSAIPNRKEVAERLRADIVNDGNRLTPKTLRIIKQWEETGDETNFGWLEENTGRQPSDSTYVDKSTTASTQFAQYQLAGGENYSETLVWALIDVGPDGDSSPMIIDTGHWSKDQAPKEAPPAGKRWALIGHMRRNERVDADGNKVSHSEEYQSGWHQKGRKEGYRDSVPPKELAAWKKEHRRLHDLVNGPFSEINKAGGLAVLNGERLLLAEKIVAAESVNQEGPPDAPFRKSSEWGLTLFKRQLRDAVEGGFDGITWTVGDTQAERYDLSKQVESVELLKASKDGTYTILAVKKGDDASEQVASGIALANIPDYIGKDLAEKIDPEAKQQEFSGLDLKVGGSGMKGFYDQIMTKEVGKYVKQWGAKVEKAMIPESGMAGAMHVVQDESGEAIASFADRQMAEAFASEQPGRVLEAGSGTPVWRVLITPEMRESVESQGQALFSSKPSDSQMSMPEENRAANQSGQPSPGGRVAEDATLKDLERAWDARGIDNFVSEKNGIITLSKIIVAKDQRGKGLGTKAMQELFEYADATGQQIALTPSGDFGGSKARLEKYYKGLGFRTYKGFKVRERLIRDPLPESPAPSPGGRVAEDLRTTHQLEWDEFRAKWSDRVKTFPQVRSQSNGGSVKPNEIIVSKENRGKGIGSKFMREMIGIADKQGRRIVISPSTDFGASSVSRLKSFYKKFGFIENKGRNKDYTISDTMYREPLKIKADNPESPAPSPGAALLASKPDRNQASFNFDTTTGLPLFDQADAKPDEGKTRRALLNDNIGLAMKIASNYSNIPGVEMADVQQEAKRALFKAAQGYDPAKGKFSSYAWQAMANRLNQVYGKMRRVTDPEESLQTPVGSEDGDATMQDMIADPSSPSAASEVEVAETMQELMGSINELAATPRGILMDRMAGLTLAEIGQKMGISRQAVQQWEARAMQAVRKKMEKRGFTGVDGDGVLRASKPDNMAQLAWIDKEAQSRGYKDATDLVNRNNEQFNSLAKQWRNRHRRIDNSTEVRNAKDSEIIDSKLFSTPDDSRVSSEIASDSAQSFLGGSARPDRAQQSGSSGKAEIVEWAKANGRLVTKLPWRLDGPRDKGEGEHHVFYDKASGRFIKITKGNGDKFGITLDLRGKKWGTGRATAWEYLERNRLSNSLFGDDIRLHGVFQDKRGNVNLIISQPDVKGDAPGDGVVLKAMRDTGFKSLGDSAYYRASDNMLVLDLHDLNANVVDGEVMVFDASVLNPTAKQLQRLHDEGVLKASKPLRSAPPTATQHREDISSEAEGIAALSDLETARRENPAPPPKTLAQSFKGLMVSLTAGRLDVIDFFAKGSKNVILDNQRENALMELGLKEINETVLSKAEVGFGPPTATSKKRYKAFVAEILPTAARLNATGHTADGQFIFSDFWMRAGELTPQQMLKSRYTLGERFIGEGGHQYRVSKRVQKETVNGGKRDFFQIERFVSAADQEIIYDRFTEKYPEVSQFLDMWIMPGAENDRIVTSNGVVLPGFNRFSLQHFFGETPWGEIGSVPAYTPDVVLTRGIAGALANVFNTRFASQGREYKSGQARESGEIMDLFAGFQKRTIEAYQETQRRKLAMGLLETALVDLPSDGVIPGDYMAFNPENLNKLLKAFHVTKGLNDTEFRALKLLAKEEMQPSVQSNLIPDFGLSEADTKRLQAFAGDIAVRALLSQNKMIHKTAWSELVRPVANFHIQSTVLRVFDAGLRSATVGYLASPFSWANNILSNELFKFMRTAQVTLHGVMAHAVGARTGDADMQRTGKIKLREASNLLGGLFFNRWYNRGWRETADRLAPIEFFEGNHRWTTIAAGDFEKTASQLLREGNVPSAILKAVGYGEMDTRAKQQMAFASYMAQASLAADDAGIKGKKERAAWMENWIKNAPPEVHREVYNTAALYALDYSNSAIWLDDGKRWELGGADITAELNAARRGMIPFMKFPYSLFRQQKRLTWDSVGTLITKDKTTAQKVEAVANLAMLAAMYGVFSMALAGAKGAGEDDEETATAIGRKYDELGKRLEGAMNTGGRINVTADTPLGRVVRGAMEMFGANDPDQDTWVRIRAIPYMLPAILLWSTTKALTSDKEGEKIELAGNAQAVLDDYVSEGILSKLISAFLGGRNDFDEGKTTSYMVTENAFDMAVGRALPSPILRAAIQQVDPIARRNKPSETLGFKADGLDAIKAKVPGLTTTLPPSGRPVKGSPTSPKTNAAVAQLESMGLAEKGVREGVDRKWNKKTQQWEDKPFVGYVDPSNITPRPRWMELLRTFGINAKMNSRSAYQATVRGEPLPDEE